MGSPYQKKKIVRLDTIFPKWYGEAKEAKNFVFQHFLKLFLLFPLFEGMGKETLYRDTAEIHVILSHRLTFISKHNQIRVFSMIFKLIIIHPNYTIETKYFQ